MFRLASLGCGAIDFALGVDEPSCRSTLGSGRSISILVSIGFEGIQASTASIALVTTGARSMAYGALALDEAIGKERSVGLDGAERLAGLPLLDEAVVPETLEDVLDNGGMVDGGRTVKDVKVDAEPVVDAAVEGMVLGAEGGRVYAFLEGLCFGRGSIFVLQEKDQSQLESVVHGAIGKGKRRFMVTHRTTDKQSLETAGSAVAGKDIGGQNTADQVPEMGDVVDIGQSTGDEDVALPRDG